MQDYAPHLDGGIDSASVAALLADPKTAAARRANVAPNAAGITKSTAVRTCPTPRWTPDLPYTALGRAGAELPPGRWSLTRTRRPVCQATARYQRAVREGTEGCLAPRPRQHASHGNEPLAIGLEYGLGGFNATPIGAPGAAAPSAVGTLALTPISTRLL